MDDNRSKDVGPGFGIGEFQKGESRGRNDGADAGSNGQPDPRVAAAFNDRVPRGMKDGGRQNQGQDDRVH